MEVPHFEDGIQKKRQAELSVADCGRLRWPLGAVREISSNLPSSGRIARMGYGNRFSAWMILHPNLGLSFANPITNSAGEQMKLLCFCFLAFALTVPVLAQDSGSIESKIIAMEKAWNQAYKLRDRRALSEILNDSIVLVNDDGSLQGKGAFLSLVDTAKPSDQQQAEPESIAVHVFGDVAIATGIFREKGVENGKAYIRKNRFVDTWVNKNGAWVCVAASATPMH
jgi:ketosteroid isomerase-like protein